MSVFAPCIADADPDSACSIESDVIDRLTVCGWTDDEPSFVSCSSKSPSYPYIKVSVLDPGEGQRACGKHKFDTIIRFRIYGRSEGCVKQLARDINSCLVASGSMTQDGQYCIRKPGFPSATCLGEGVVMVNLSLPITIFA